MPIKKITKRARNFICSLSGQYKSAAEIRQMLAQRYEIDVTIDAIYYVIHANKKTVEKFKQKYMSEALDVPLAIEKVRMERNETLYQLSQTSDELTDKEKITTGLMCLKEARDEMKGSQIGSVTLNQYNQYNNLTDEQLKQEIKRIESRIAATLNLKKKGEVYAIDQDRTEGSNQHEEEVRVGER